MKKIFILCLAVSSLAGMAQVTDADKQIRIQSNDTTSGWKTGGIGSLGFSQTSLNNWIAGGQNSISVNGLVSVFSNRKTEKWAWDNSLDLGYGLLQQGSSTGFRKTDDKVDITSKFGMKASKNWYYAALLNFKTQMTPGYNYPNDSIKISNLLAPGYLLGALGMDYKPVNSFSLFLAPLTTKATYVQDQILADAGAFGVEKAVYDNSGIRVLGGKTSRYEFGGYLRMKYSKTLMSNVSVETRLDLFSNYLHNPQNIDINWENLITLKVNKFLSASINTQLIYDDDIDISVDDNNDGITDKVGPRVQFKEIITVGLSYKY